jgi:hypothetical protein
MRQILMRQILLPVLPSTLPQPSRNVAHYGNRLAISPEKFAYSSNYGAGHKE